MTEHPEIEAEAKSIEDALVRIAELVDRDVETGDSRAAFTAIEQFRSVSAQIELQAHKLNRKYGDDLNECSSHSVFGFDSSLEWPHDGNEVERDDDKDSAVCIRCHMLVRHDDLGILGEMMRNHEKISGHQSGWDDNYDEVALSELLEVVQGDAPTVRSKILLDKHQTPWAFHYSEMGSPGGILQIECKLGKESKGRAQFSVDRASSSCPDGYGELVEIEIQPELRRRQLGSIMIDWGKCWLRRRGVMGVWGRLLYEHDTRANKSFYERNGFVVILDNPNAEHSEGQVRLDFPCAIAEER